MNYILFESKAPTELAHHTQATLAADLADADHRATLVLIQDGVFWLTMRPELAAQWGANQGVEVLVDSFSLQLRGLRDMPLPEPCKVCDAAEIVRRLAQAPVKAIWR
jgi:sulfur transfer complex TusBCD TusB component (DsrH family)